MHATGIGSGDGFDFSGLTVTERIDLAQRLWESVREAVESAPLTESEAAEVENRIRDIDRAAMVCEPLALVVSRIGRRWAGGAVV